MPSDFQMDELVSPIIASKILLYETESDEKRAKEKFRSSLVNSIGVIISCVCLLFTIAGSTNFGMVSKTVEIGMWEYCNIVENECFKIIHIIGEYFILISEKLFTKQCQIFKARTCIIRHYSFA